MAIDKYPLKSGGYKYRATTYVQGKRIQKRGFKTKKEAQRWIERTRVDGQTYRPLTYQEVEDRFMETYSLAVKGSSVAAMKSSLRNHVPKEWRNRLISSITPAEGKRFMNAMAKSMVSGMQHVSRISQVFDFAIEIDAIRKNPLGGRRPKAQKNEKDANALWTVEQIAIFLEACKKVSNPSVYPFFCLLLMTGMRKGEALALRWIDVDTTSRLIRIEHGLTIDEDNQPVISDPKYHSSRIIAIDKRTAEAIDSLRNQASTGRIFPYTRYWPNRWMDKIAKEVGLPHSNPHTFRDEHATVLVQSGAQIKDVQERLGHKSAATTMNYYVKANRDKFAAIKGIDPDRYTNHYTDSEKPLNTGNETY